MFSSIPVDILADIISRLPVKTLLRFRCVSKPWCGMIDGPEFVRLHLNRSIETNSNLSLIFEGELEPLLQSVEFDLLDTAHVLDHPLKGSCGSSLYGSCNGLLLLGGQFEKGIVIWNPSTQKFRKLPDSPWSPPGYPRYIRSIIFGFGYDYVHDDYKVIRIVQFYCNEYDVFSSEVKVYSLKANSWRRIQDFPYYLCFRIKSEGVLASGALHWIVKQKRDADVPTIVVAFDVVSEEYRLVPEPDYAEGCCSKDLNVLGQCLCITCSYYKDRVDVWVMKEYGVNESWTKLLSVLPPTIQIIEYMKPLAYSRSRDRILFDFDNKKLFWYDLSGKIIKEVTVRDMPFSFDVKACVASLVPVYGCDQTNGKNQQEQKKIREETKMKKRDDFLSQGFKLVL